MNPNTSLDSVAESTNAGVGNESTPEDADVLAEVERLIDALTAHADPAVGEATTRLLNRIDVVHRAALTHLMGAIQSRAGDAFVNRLTSDPAIRLLLMSYDLLAFRDRFQSVGSKIMGF